MRYADWPGERSCWVAFYKNKTFQYLYHQPCIFTEYVTSFFPILSWSRVYEIQVTSNVTYIVFLVDGETCTTPFILSTRQLLLVYSYH